jgi:hypothetical protein
MCTNPQPVERTHLTLTLTQIKASMKSPSLHLSGEPLVSGFCCTAPAAAFSFSNNSTLCALSVTHELVPKPSTTRILEQSPYTTTFVETHKGTPPKQRLVLKVPNRQEFAWGVTMRVWHPYGFSCRERPPAVNYSKTELPVCFPFTFTSSFHCCWDFPQSAVVFFLAELTKVHQQTLMHPSLECNTSSLLGDYTRLPTAI